MCRTCIPWLPLIAIAFGLEFAPTAEVEMLAEKNRRPKLHEAVGEFLAPIFPGPGLIAIENAHHIDMASAELLSYLAGGVGGRPWVFGVARRPSAAAFTASAAVRIELAPLDASDALRMAQRAAEQHPLPMHVLEVVAKRSGEIRSSCATCCARRSSPAASAASPSQPKRQRWRGSMRWRRKTARSCAAQPCSA